MGSKVNVVSSSSISLLANLSDSLVDFIAAGFAWNNVVPAPANEKLSSSKNNYH